MWHAKRFSDSWSKILQNGNPWQKMHVSGQWSSCARMIWAVNKYDGCYTSNQFSTSKQKRMKNCAKIHHTFCDRLVAVKLLNGCWYLPMVLEIIRKKRPSPNRILTLLTYFEAIILSILLDELFNQAWRLQSFACVNLLNWNWYLQSAGRLVPATVIWKGSHGSSVPIFCAVLVVQTL